MRIILLLFLTFLTTLPSFSQVPDKKQMNAEMQQLVTELKQQIADLEKQIAVAKKEDPESVKDLQDELTMLNKQLTMIQGVSKSVSKMKDSVFVAAAEEGNIIAPKKDSVRISRISRKIFTDAELFSFVKNVATEVEKILPVAEKSEASKIFNETKAKYNSTYAVSSAASGCWMLGHWEKALYLMGRVCIEDIDDPDNLNNYAAFLIMSGGEQAAIPILQYLNKKYPDNSTIKNNIGQAWFGLGDMKNAKNYLDSVTNLYGGHSLANATLGAIYESEGDKEKTIAVLKRAIKETYDTEKEHALNRLGVNLTYADLPELNYPMKNDPFNIISLVKILPENYPAKIGDDEKVNAIDRYLNGVRKFSDELNSENEILKTKQEQEAKRMVLDSQYRYDYLEAHNTPGYKLAARSLALLIGERYGGSSPFPVHLLIPGVYKFGENENVKTDLEILEECNIIWRDSVLEPIAALAQAMSTGGYDNPSCAQIDAVTDAYYTKVAEIKRKGTKLIKQVVAKNENQLTKWAKINLYASMDEPFKNTDDLTGALVNHVDFTINRKKLYNYQLGLFLDMAEKIVKRQEFIKSSCNTSSETKSHTEDADDLAWLKIDLDCEFKKVVNVPVIVYTFTCNTKKEEPKNLKKRKPNVSKGAASNAKRRNQNKARGPLGNRPNGPYYYYEPEEAENISLNKGPLTPEDKDPSQFSIEYDKWGNIIDIKFQLNKDGTGLADPDSAETEIESRWSWNAIASPKKGYLNKLSVKFP